jgi:acetyl coenzyme A synthetase (ADP forming)-like protein
VRAYPSLVAIPDPVDLAVLVVPKGEVPHAIDDCVAKGVKGVVVISAGFGETGPAGKAVQDEMVRKIRAAGIRMVGPNCLGLVNTESNFSVNASFAPTWPPAGHVGMSSQSGALGLAILDYAQEIGIGISQFVSVGNKADVSSNDLLEFWEGEDNTRVILLYMENFGNPQRFMQIARRVTRKKPIVAVKSGRTEAGARAASSHTGSLAGLDIAVDAVLGQAGVLRTDTLEELFDVAMLLANQPVPAGKRVGVLTNAGGPGIMASDACESRGLVLPPLSPETETALREFLPAEASVKNPVDMIASASADSYERALKLMLADEKIDSVLVIFVPPIVTEASEVASAIRRAGAGATKPVLTCFLGKHGVPAALSSMREGKFPSYAFPESAAIALSRAVRYGEWQKRPEGIVPTLRDVKPEVARKVIATKSAEGAADTTGRWLDHAEVRDVLAAYGIEMPRTVFAATEQEAARAAEAMGYPVALKLSSTTITHKSDVGGVMLDLTDARSVAAGFSLMRGRLAERGLAAQMDGVIVQQMIKGGVETFIGVTYDPTFGPLLGFGIGGVNVEVWKDVVFRVHPLTDVDAGEMLEQIRGRKLLEGYRGAAPADREALIDALLRVSRLVDDLPEICELDINPLVARGPGQGVVAVDARIRVRT